MQHSAKIPSWMTGPDATEVVAEAREIAGLLHQHLDIVFRNGAPAPECLVQFKHGWMVACAATLAARQLRGLSSDAEFVGHEAEMLAGITRWLIRTANLRHHDVMVDRLVEVEHLMAVWLQGKDYATRLTLVVGRFGKAIAKRYGGMISDPLVLTVDVRLNKRDDQLLSLLCRQFRLQIEPELAHAACGS